MTKPLLPPLQWQVSTIDVDGYIDADLADLRPGDVISMGSIASESAKTYACPQPPDERRLAEFDRYDFGRPRHVEAQHDAVNSSDPDPVLVDKLLVENVSY
ncbi:hypothetical protein [Rhizobium sp. RAF56]|uniref:hypothetical protein n=1 Tax=Rhizobium sp. RAF56 TaxID=3233062 RepID=UPI003F9D8F46